VLAIIIAGGRGERMRRSGSEVPKALTPFNGQRLIAWLCRHLQQHGVDRLVVALGHRAEETAAGLGRLRSGLPGLQLDWVDTGLDSGNGGRLLRLGAHRPQRTFIMCWCDAITDLDVGAMQSIRDAAARHRLGRESDGPVDHEGLDAHRGDQIPEARHAAAQR
jgi:NDP-sugar pyrophosphorylase family protein